MATDLQPRPFAFDAAHRYTLEGYYRLVEEGLLDEDARVELLDGQLIPMSPIGPRHQRIVTKLFKTFTRQERGRFVAEQDCPLSIPDYDEPEPDLVLYWPGAADEQRHVRPADVLLVVEVAQSSLGRDLGQKARIYEGAKIPEYWVIDLEGNCLKVFRLAGRQGRCGCPVRWRLRKWASGGKREFLFPVDTHPLPGSA